MKLVKEEKIYRCLCTYEERLIPKQAGFRWDPEKKQWWTNIIENAAKLSEYADEELMVELAAALKQHQQNLQDSKATRADIEIPRPEGLEYMPFQKAGIAYAKDKAGVLFGDEMGLGKTIEAIGILNLDPEIKNALVVCPASLKLNWQREIQKWLVHDLSVGIAYPRQWPNTNIVIVNYDILNRFPELYQKTAGKNLLAYVGPEWDYLILDEAHYIKSWKAQRSKLVKKIKARCRLLLTGTPIINRPIELWNLINYLDPLRWKSFRWYTNRYCDAYQKRIGRKLYWDFSGASNLDELQEKLRSTLLIRRLKKEVLPELPPKIRQVIEISKNGCLAYVEAERKALEEQENVLEDLRIKVELAKASGSEEEYEQAVKNLREGVSLAFKHISSARHDIAVAKIPSAIPLLHDAVDSSGKVVIFAHHHDVVHRLKEEFGDEAVLVYGQTKQEDRQRHVDRFQTDPACKVFIGSITAAGVGITLTASSHVVFMELDWVPGNMHQAEDRLHRIGQKDSVLVQHLVLENSIDARLAKTLVAKQKIIDDALDREHEKQEVVIPEASPSISASRKKLIEEAEKLAPAQIQAIHEGLRILDRFCDGAIALDGMGFNKIDTGIGKSLAGRSQLTPRQAALGKKLVIKYQRQLPGELIEVIKGVRE